VVDDVRKERIPCILPHVVFISCNILELSVFDKDEDPNPELPGDLLNRGRLGVRGENTGDCIDGKPMEDAD
jgi:hypothetical protein